MRLNGHDAAALELLGSVGEDEIGHLFDGRINRPDQGNPQQRPFGDSPKGPANEIADQYTYDIDQHDGEDHA